MAVKNRITLLQGDITELNVEAIVNAANNSLLGGGGVDGAIHRAAGPELLDECRAIGGCPTGEARLTRGYHLPAKWVIHTVGPIWYGGDNGEKEELENCYRNSLKLAHENNMSSIAFPAISCGVYGYPLQEAADIAVNTVVELLKEYSGIREVTFCTFSHEMTLIYKGVLASIVES